MIHNMYSILDLKTGAFNVPFAASADEVAVRMVSAVVNERDGNYINKFPADFALYSVGGFDGESGAFVLNDSPVCLSNCAALVIKEVA